MCRHVHPCRLLLGIGLLLVALQGCKQSGSGDARDPAPKPPTPTAVHTDDAAPPAPALRLVVLVVVDQLPSWWLDTVTDLIAGSAGGDGNVGGIGRMLREGVYYPEADLSYAVTYTAPGHAAIATGAPPAVTGILSNDWYRRALGREVAAAEDVDSPVHHLTAAPGSNAVGSNAVGSNAVGSNAGVSGVQLRVPGIADALEQATGGKSKTVAIALKDRAAALVLGRRPDLAIWYESAQPAMTTSRYYAAEPPAWLRTLAREQPVSRYYGTAWTPLAGVDHAALTGGPDDAAGEGEFYGLRKVFPHRLDATPRPAKAVPATPAGDALVLDVARAALAAEGLGQDAVPDLLALSFSAQDYVGHVWGAESWERLDVFLRLDRALGELMAELDQRVGRGAYAMVLTSDHGVARMVERVRSADRPARRILSRDIEEVAQEAAARVLGKGTWVAASSASTVYMSKDFGAQAQARRDAALDAVVAALAGMEGIAHAARTDRLAGGCDARAGMEALACRSLIPEESGEVFFASAPDFPITGFPTGTNHGSPGPDDRLVPVLIHAPGHARWGTPRVVREPVSVLQVAATLAQLLGIAPPASATAPALPGGR